MIESILDIVTRKNAEEYFRVRRWRATAQTWVQKVAVSLRHQYEEAESESTRYLLSEEAARLLYNMLEETRRLVPMLQDDTIHTFEMVEREAKGLVKALRNAQLAAKMQNMSGRTPEEIKMFQDKLNELNGEQ